MRTIIVWLRNDLRLADNPALSAALETAERVVPVYVHEPDLEGAASRWWRHHSLAALGDAMRARGGRLILRQGSAARALTTLVRETGAQRVYWNRAYEPGEIEREHQVQAAMTAAGAACATFPGNLMFEPWAVASGSGRPYRVFTPYWRACRRRGMDHGPLPAPPVLTPVARRLGSERLNALALRPRIAWDQGLACTWRVGEAAAAAHLDRVCRTALEHYEHDRDLPALEGTSRLSPYLHFGEISTRQVAWALNTAALEPTSRAGARVLFRQLGWREFAYHVLYHFPHTPRSPLDERFAAFPWREEAAELERRWQQGRTGFPLIDAGMRELWATGWMHNRVRMLAASFLTKNCRVSWVNGVRWFRDTLVDADLANNTLGWQWTAGCGADAAPYFRIFNPVLQGERFDPDGAYVRRWVPELKRLPARWIHRPWAAPAHVLAKAGVALGTDYPHPLVDLEQSRRDALAAYRAVRGGG